ncbi:MAG: hypothetical protein GWO20_07985 [Candidatus Korarchaeota archaeon]|nr:hypothetical protein [Candidatus Korarchaeota archaeon]NIU83432.1 hypothetical protein [Candidatus Thorarchaeota archaeon]NIW13704.1 hypothetical protein [Candidatus Thorarchaeota archaeon]NIW51803.1 hypothetical protein [Candidatus Korarchaeota archaeon]
MNDETIKNRVFPYLTYLLTLMSGSGYLTAKALEGYFGLQIKEVTTAVFGSFPALLIIYILYFAFFILSWISWKLKPAFVVFSTLFALIVGSGIFSTVFYIANLISATIVPEALAITSGVFILACVYQWITGKDLLGWGFWLFFFLLVVLGLTVAQLFITLTLFHIAVDIGVIILFIFIVMYDLFVTREEFEDDQWPLAVLAFFLDFINILIRVIYLLLILASESQ